MTTVLERRLQDAVSVALGLLEQHDLANKSPTEIEAAVKAAEELCERLERLCAP